MKGEPIRLTVFLHQDSQFIRVGELGYKNHQSLFEYDSFFLAKGIEISPFHLPLKPGVFVGDRTLFNGLFGVFNDSLPDGWGRILIDRNFRKQGVDPASLTPLDRLSQTGTGGMGALLYEPDESIKGVQNDLNLDQISSNIEEVLKGDTENMLEYLIALNGSSAGARPKIMVGVSSDRKHLIYGTSELPNNFEPWIIKFRSSYDSKDMASIEYAYGLMAQEAGIAMPETHLFITPKTNTYFGIKRFDRVGTQKIHMHSLSGLLHTDHRIPSMDYVDVLKATFLLTKDIREVKKMFGLAVFNVLSCNRDDHSKNFSFLMNEKGEWRVSPGYDLTFSTGPGGEHATTVMGEGKHFKLGDLKKLGIQSGLPITDVKETIEQVRSSLSKWSLFAEAAFLPKETTSRIGKDIS